VFICCGLCMGTIEELRYLDCGRIKGFIIGHAFVDHARLVYSPDLFI
jgi:hypothetical protein